MRPSTENQLFRRTTQAISFPKSNQDGKKIQECAESLILPSKILLMIHGNFQFISIPFFMKASVLTILTISIIVVELLTINLLYDNFKVDNEGNKSRRNMVFFSLWILNWLVRIFFYQRRKDLESVILRLVRIYFKIDCKNRRLQKFKVVLVLILTLYQVLIIVQMGFRGYNIYHKGSKDVYFGIIPPPYASYCHIISDILVFWTYIESVISCYFCSVCYLLKEILTAFDKELEDENATTDTVFNLHIEITELIDDANDVVHPILLVGLALILTSVFNSAYTGVFMASGLESYVLLLTSAVLLSNLVFICTFGASVINAASQAKNSAQNQFIKSKQHKSLQSVLEMNDNFEGFKLLNSIIIDNKLLLSALGFLLSYGILIATFNVTSSVGK